MTEQPDSWAEARRKARQRAVQMGLAVPEEPVLEPRPQDVLPTLNPFAVRGLLRTGRLNPVQQRAARQFLSDLEPKRPNDDTQPPGDAA